MAYLLDETISNLRYGGLANWLSLLIIAVTIIILSTLILVGGYIHAEVSQLKKEAAIVAFLKNNLVPSDIQALRTQLEERTHINSVKYVSKTEALSRAREVFGEQGELVIEGLEELNPLPASFELEMKSSALEPETIERVAKELRSYPQIEDVRYEQSSSEFIKKAELLASGLGILLGGASIVVVCFSIMLTSYFRQEEIRVMRLVGATYWFIRIPLIMQGIILGFLGTILGLVLFSVIFHFLASQIGIFSFLSIKQLFEVILIGIGLGLIGGSIPVGKYSRI